MTKHSRYLNFRIHKTENKLDSEELKLSYCANKDLFADFYTKVFTITEHERNLERIMNKELVVGNNGGVLEQVNVLVKCMVYIVRNRGC